MSITIHDLALFRGIEEADGGFSGGEYLRVKLPFMGGCEVCHATLAPYNAYPSKSGMLRCAECILDSGYETVEEANADIFGDEDDTEMDHAVELLKSELGATEVE